jgi:puromycin-sensitive aminopeptidase
LIKFEEFENKFCEYACGLFKEQGKKLGWTQKSNETHLDSLLRGVIIYDLGKYGDKETKEEVKELFKKFINDNSVVLPDLRSAFYSIAIKNIGKEALDEIIKIFKSTDLNEEKVRILGSLGSISSKEELQNLLEW